LVSGRTPPPQGVVVGQGSRVLPRPAPGPPRSYDSSGRPVVRRFRGGLVVVRPVPHGPPGTSPTVTWVPGTPGATPRRTPDGSCSSSRSSAAPSSLTPRH